MKIPELAPEHRRLGRAVWPLLFLALAACAEVPPQIMRLTTAVRSGPGDAAPKTVTLPDTRNPAPGAVAPIAEYRLDLDSFTDPRHGIGVFVTVSNAPFAATVNGTPVFQNGDSGSRPISYLSWRASPSFRIAPELLRSRNEFVLRLYDQPGASATLGPVLVGDPAAIERWAMREGLLHHGAPLLIGAALLGVGLIALSLWRGRRDGFLFLLLAGGTLLWGAQSIMQQLPSPLLPRPHQGVLNIAMYVWYPMLLSVFFMRFAYSRWRIYEWGAVAFCLLAAPALYAGWYAGHAGSVSIVLRAAVLVWISVALFAVLRYAWRERNTKGYLLLIAGTLCVGFALRDWLVSVFGSDVRSVVLTGYSGLALVVLAGWMLIERYHKAYAAAVASNADLEARVSAANAELANRLAQVQAAREQAEQASFAKSRFFAAASHDLRQPLHSLGLFAAALNAHVQSSTARELVGRIGESIAALEALFNELLDLSKLDAGAVSVRRRSISLQELFDRLSLEFHGEAVARELRLRFVPTRLSVQTDPILLERILANLVSNALRYTPQGGVVIGARRRGEQVWIDVCDSGIGIATEEQSQVFDEFYQVGNPGRDRRRGLGLGLAIVRRLVTLLGHELTLQSAPGRGTRFRLCLPRAEGPVDPLLVVEHTPVLDAFIGRRILLVEDDADIRHATATLLGQWGLTVKTAAGAREADAAVDAGFRPDLAIVDLRLDALHDGIDVIERLRQRLGPELSALLLSGDTGAAEISRVKSSGLPLLTKPVSPARLKSALHAYLSTAPEAAAGA